MDMKQQQYKLQIALILLSLIGSALLQPDVHRLDPNDAKNKTLEELRDALRTIEGFIETEEMAEEMTDRIQAGK